MRAAVTASSCSARIEDPSPNRESSLRKQGPITTGGYGLDEKLPQRFRKNRWAGGYGALLLQGRRGLKRRRQLLCARQIAVGVHAGVGDREQSCHRVVAARDGIALVAR